MNMGECPGNTAEAEPIGYLCVFIDVTRIIVVDEVMPERLAKNNPRKHCQRDADAEGKPPTVHFRRACALNSEPVHVFRKNDEARMTKEIQMTAPEKKRRLPWIFFAIRAFVIDSSVVLRHG